MALCTSVSSHVTSTARITPTAPAARTRPAQHEALQAYWDDRAASFGMDAGTPDAWARLIEAQLTRYLPTVDRARVLDIGCGPGALTVAMARRGHKVTGVDFSPRMIEEATCNLSAADCTAHLAVADADALPIAPGSFDLVIHRNVMWALAAPDQALAAWHDALRADGLLVYFDSAWYGYLHDEEANRLRLERYGTGTSATYDVMERQARDLPLTWVDRPAWDLEHLARAGFEVLGAYDASHLVWSAAEQARYAFAPQFMIVGRRLPRPAMETVAFAREIHVVDAGDATGDQRDAR